jgi:hypothetical protein
VSRTRLGYTVRQIGQTAERATLVERLSALSGLALMALALGDLFFPQTQVIQDQRATLMAISAAVMTAGVAFLWIAIRGLRYEVKFDLDGRKMHYMACNHLGGRRVLRTLDFDEIGSAFVRRAIGSGELSRLYVRVGDSEDVIEVARGGDTELKNLHSQLSKDLPRRRSFR